MKMEQKILKAQETFISSFYYEHLESASFLYDQRLSLFNNAEITWTDIEDFENRFEAHIDGLVIGQDLAMDVCKKQAEEGDFGELHTAISVFCRQNRPDLIKQIFEETDLENEENIQAISDALNRELPADLQNDFIQMLTQGNEKLIPIIAKLIGYHRLPAETELLTILQNNTNQDAIVTILWAISRVRKKNGQALLYNYLKHEDENICTVAALALLRIGEYQAINDCLYHVHSKNWTILPLGLGGSSSAVPALIQIASSPDVSPDCLLSLGLLGDIAAIEILIAHLDNPEFAESSATALNLITSAEIYEDVFIPKEIDKDELFEDEIEKLKQGESLYPPGEEPGTTITRISQNPHIWQKWWTENKSRFSPTIRYRNGKPYSPACLLENLESEKSPRIIRQLAYEELVIRYDIDFPFETDMFVAQQKQAIAKYSERIEANNNHFQAGKWYFAGRLVT